jgi:hypothetical protein
LSWIQLLLIAKFELILSPFEYLSNCAASPSDLIAQRLEGSERRLPLLRAVERSARVLAAKKILLSREGTPNAFS